MPIRKVKCKKCGKLYPSKVEDDYSDVCGDCEHEYTTAYLRKQKRCE